MGYYYDFIEQLKGCLCSIIKKILSMIINPKAIVFLFFIYSFSLNAQEYGVKATLNTTWLKGTDQTSIRILPQLGIVARLGDIDGLHFNAEYLFSFKGAGANTQEFKRNITTLYNEIAIMLSYTVNQDFTVRAGFQPSILLFGHMKEVSNDNVHRRGITREISRFDYTTSIGLEYRYNEIITLGMRYHHSFVPVVKYNNPIFNNPNLFIWRGLELFAVHDIFNPK